MRDLKQLYVNIKELKLPELPFIQVPVLTRTQISIWVVRSLLFAHHKELSLNGVDHDTEVVKLRDLVLANLRHLNYGDNLLKNTDFGVALIDHIDELFHYVDCLLSCNFGKLECVELKHNTQLTEEEYTLPERWFWICTATKSSMDSEAILKLQIGLSKGDKTKLITAFREPTMMEKMKGMLKPKANTFSPKNW